MNDPVTPFHRRLVRLRRDRAAAGFAGYDFLLQHAVGEIADRLADVKRSFARVLVLGCHTGQVASIFVQKPELLVQADISYAMARQATGAVVADEEFLPFAAGTFDLVIAPLTLHWVNDLPGTLLQIRNILKPDGLFLGTLLGGETLWQLRQVLLQAESETSQVVGPRVSPFADLRDMGALMQRANFALPVVDSDSVTATYADLFRLLKDLRGMAATHAPSGIVRPLTRATMVRAAELYETQFAESDGRIPATFQMIHIAGWSPDPSQQKPLRPGSAKVRLADVLGTNEITLET
jgi:SAM-dependent methyltransferase